MFTGIVKQTSKVIDTKTNNDGMLLTIKKPDWEVNLGDSIMINGVCSTVKSASDDQIVFEYMPETLQKSNLGDLKTGDIVNLEPSLRASDRLDGHIVQGHIDTTGSITEITDEGNSKVFKIKVNHPDEFMRLVASKGSVAIDGISLTSVDVIEDTFTVKIIPYTLEHTNLEIKSQGDTVNLEFDILAKYLARLMKP